MKELLEKKKWLIIRAGILLFGLLIFSGFLWPMATGIWQRWGKVKSHQIKVEEARSWHEVTRRLQSENDKLKVELSAFYQSAPQEEALSRIIQSLQQAGARAGLRFTYLKPHRDEKTAQYQKIPIELELTGLFHKLGTFLHLLESSENIVRIERLELRTKDMLSQKLKIHLQLSVFFINS